MEELDSQLSQPKGKSTYQRISIHNFHILQDQASCCCCVPLPMAYHVIGVLDILILSGLIFNIYEATSIADEYLKQGKDTLVTYYRADEYVCIAILVSYSFPRMGSYLYTVIDLQSIERITLYFKVRIVT